MTPRVRGARRKEEPVPLDMPSPPNLAMELLCLLSPRPQWLDAIADDLGIANNERVIRLCRQLRDKGLGVELGDCRGYTVSHARQIECAWISLPAWPEVRQRAQRWWERSRARQEAQYDATATG